jgi:hypothetical protein
VKHRGFKLSLVLYHTISREQIVSALPDSQSIGMNKKIEFTLRKKDQSEINVFTCKGLTLSVLGHMAAIVRRPFTGYKKICECQNY